MYFFRCQDKDQALGLVKDMGIFKEEHRRIEASSSTPWWRVQQAKIAKVYASNPVQIAVAVLIFSNFLANAAQSEMLPEDDSDAYVLFQRIDDFFTWIFFFEILLNLSANWFSPFFQDGWSCFDLLVVTVSMVTYFMPGESSGPMKTFRLMRAFRVMRLFGRLQSLRQIVSALTASIVPVLNAFLIMLLITSIYAILGVNFFSENFPENFGTFSRALFTMFQVCTGDSWASGLARPIMLKTNPDGTIDLGPCLYFISFVVIVGWVLLQVVVAVLLDNFTEASYEEKSRKALEKAKNDNFIKKVNILDPLLAGLAHFDTAEDLTQRIRLLFQVLDSDDSGSLSFRELTDGLKKLRVKPRIELSESHWDEMTLDGSLLNEKKELGLGDFIRMMKHEFKLYVQRQISNAMDVSNPDKEKKTSAILFVMKLFLVRLDELQSGLDYNPTKAGQDRMSALEEKMDLILHILKTNTENSLPQMGAQNSSPQPPKMKKIWGASQMHSSVFSTDALRNSSKASLEAGLDSSKTARTPTIVGRPELVYLNAGRRMTPGHATAYAGAPGCTSGISPTTLVSEGCSWGAAYHVCTPLKRQCSLNLSVPVRVTTCKGPADIHVTPTPGPADIHVTPKPAQDPKTPAQVKALSTYLSTPVHTR